MKKKIFTIIITLVVSFSIFASLSVDEIVDKYEANQKFESLVTEAKIEITDRLGVSIQNVLVSKNKVGDTLIEITSGPDRGQKVLRRDESIYLYYPDADQVIRLQGTALKDSFMGSDFSYEDLSGDDTIRGSYDIELKEELDSSYVLSLTAKTRQIAYQKEELIIDKKTFVCTKAILMGTNGRALRSMESSDIKEINGYYFAMKTVMTDLLKKEGNTVFELEEVEVNPVLQPSLFTKENLSW